jgi:hypothetical protein
VAIYIPAECHAVIAVQRGVLGRQQALDLGLRPDSIETLLRTRRWRTVHRGVYAAFTGRPSRETLCWAALVRAGPSAFLSHQTAAELYGFDKDHGDEGKVHVSVPRSSCPTGISGVVVHRVSQAALMCHPYLLPPRTRIEPTVLDLVESAKTIEDAFGWIFRATGKGVTNAGRLRQEIGRRGNLRWRSPILDSLADVEQGVRSNLEYRYVRGVERPHGLPRAGRQVRVVRSGRVCYLDNLYDEYLVGVELDGLVAHPPGERWRDFRRDNAGAADGIMTLRYGWADVTGQPCAVAGQVAAVLHRRGWTGTVRACGRSCAARQPPELGPGRPPATGYRPDTTVPGVTPGGWRHTRGSAGEEGQARVSVG